MNLFLLISFIFVSAETFPNLKDRSVKLIDSFEGSSSISLVIIDAGLIDVDIKPSVNIEVLNFTETLKQNSFFDILNFTSGSLVTDKAKKEIEELRQAIRFDYNNNPINLNKKLRLLKKLIANNNCKCEETNNFNEAYNNTYLTKAILKDSKKELAKIFEYSLFLTYFNLDDTRVRVSSLNSSELDFYISSLKAIEPVKDEPEYSDKGFLTVLKNDVIDIFDTQLAEQKELYRLGLIEHDDYYSFAKVTTMEKAIINEIFDSLKKESLEVILTRKLMDYNRHVLNETISYNKTKESANNMVLLINSDLFNTKHSILDVLKENKISYTLYKPKFL